VISEGRIGQFDTPHALYSHPKDAGVARFLGEANLMPGTVGADGVRTELGVLVLETWSTVPASGRVTVMVRPRTAPSSAPRPTGAPLAGVVREYQYFGHDAVVKCNPTPGPPTPAWSCASTAAPPLSPGPGSGCEPEGRSWPGDPLTHSPSRPEFRDITLT